MKIYKFSVKRIITLFTLSSCAIMHSQQRPDSMPNGGHLGGNDWTIKDYQENAEKDSLKAVRIYDHNLKLADFFKPKESLKKKKLNTQQEEYEKRLTKAKEDFDREVKSIQQYRDDWIAYLKAQAIARVKAQEELERQAEEERIQEEKADKIALEKAQEKQKTLEAEWKAMPTNPQYQQWKAKYEKAISLAQANVDKCESIIKKHTFKNIFGQKQFDSSEFSDSEKKVFNQNLESLAKYNDEIGKLEEEKYYGFWNETVTMQESTSSYRLSSYYNNTSKVY